MKIFLSTFLISPDVTAHAINTIDVDLDKIETDFDKFIDNRDFTIFRVLDNETWEETQKNESQWFDDQKKWIKLRHLLLKTFIIGHCNLYKEGDKDNTNTTKSLSTNSIGAKLDGNSFTNFTENLEKLELYYHSLKNEPTHLNSVIYYFSKSHHVNKL